MPMKKTFKIGFIVSLFLLFSFVESDPKPQFGLGTYYSDKLQGHRTSSGERYDKLSYTAAHKTLPFGTKVKVTNLKTNLSVIVKVNDRGPFTKGYVIDVSKVAAQDLGLIKYGSCRVKVEVVGSDTKIGKQPMEQEATPVVKDSL